MVELVFVVLGVAGATDGFVGGEAQLAQAAIKIELSELAAATAARWV